MNWTIENARQHFSEVINQAVLEPQPIMNDTQIVATVVDAKTFKAFELWQKTHSKKRSPANAFAELRGLCVEEDYVLEVPVRCDRENDFICDDI